MKVWKKKGIKYFIIFQDTNSLAFESIPILLGSSINNNFDVNYLIVERYEGEKASILCSCEDKGRKFNIRAIDYSCLTGLLGEKINNRNESQSYFPAVTNVICFELNSYIHTLINTNNELPQYILSNNQSHSFRLESVLQDIVILTSEKNRMNSIYMERWLCFNPVKEISNENDFYTPDDGERKLYLRNKNKLKKLGWKIGSNTSIHIDPLISFSTENIKKHFQGIIEIESNSKLVIDGNVFINNVYLKGSLTIRIKSGGVLRINNLNIKNKGTVIKTSEGEYFKQKKVTIGELILEYGNGSYEANGIIMKT